MEWRRFLTAIGIPGALAVASGQAAETLAILTLCESGDHVVLIAAVEDGAVETYPPNGEVVTVLALDNSFIDEIVEVAARTRRSRPEARQRRMARTYGIPSFR